MNFIICNTLDHIRFATEPELAELNIKTRTVKRFNIYKSTRVQLLEY